MCSEKLEARELRLLDEISNLSTKQPVPQAAWCIEKQSASPPVRPVHLRAKPVPEHGWHICFESAAALVI